MNNKEYVTVPEFVGKLNYIGFKIDLMGITKWFLSVGALKVDEQGLLLLGDKEPSKCMLIIGDNIHIRKGMQTKLFIDFLEYIAEYGFFYKDEVK